MNPKAIEALARKAASTNKPKRKKGVTKKGVRSCILPIN